MSETAPKNSSQNPSELENWLDQKMTEKRGNDWTDTNDMQSLKDMKDYLGQRPLYEDDAPQVESETSAEVDPLVAGIFQNDVFYDSKAKVVYTIDAVKGDGESAVYSVSTLLENGSDDRQIMTAAEATAYLSGKELVEPSADRKRADEQGNSGTFEQTAPRDDVESVKTESADSEQNDNSDQASEVSDSKPESNGVESGESDEAVAFKALSRDEKATELTKAIPWAAEMIKDMDDHALNGYAGTFETSESVKRKDDTESSESVETPADTNAPSEIPSESEKSDAPSSDEEKSDDKVEVADTTVDKFAFLDDARAKLNAMKRKESDSEKVKDDQLDESGSEPSVAPVAYAEFENTDTPKPSRFGRLADKLKGIFKRKNNALESGDKTAAERAESEAKTIRKRIIGVIAIGAAIMGGAAAIRYGMDHQWALPFLDGDNDNQLESIPDDTYEVPGLQPDGTVRESVPTPSSLMNYLTEHNVLNGEGGESLLDRNDIDSSSWYGFQDDLMSRYPDEFYRMEDGNVGLQNPGSLSAEAQKYISRYK